MNKVDDLLKQKFEEAWNMQMERLSKFGRKLVLDTTDSDEALKEKRFEYENGVIAEDEEWNKSRDAEYYDTAHNHHLYDEKGRCILDEKLFQKVYYPDSNQVEFYWDDNSFKHFTKSGKEDTEEYYATQKVRQLEKQQLINDFEKGGRTETDYSIEEHKNRRDFFYGVPVFEHGKLKGFNMMTFSKSYDDMGLSSRSDDKKYEDKEGRQVFMDVDEYFKFYKEHEEKDGRPGALLRKTKEQYKIENFVLNNSKLGKLRNKLAKKIDSILGTNLKDKKIAKPIKKIEKAVSNKLFGKVNE